MTIPKRFVMQVKSIDIYNISKENLKFLHLLINLFKVTLISALYVNINNIFCGVLAIFSKIKQNTCKKKVALFSIFANLFKV